MNKNALVEKLTSRFFRKVEDAVWDMATGTIGPKFGYCSRGKGEGLPGNKHAKSSFKQNKSRGF